jgi:hypothetical protein
MPEYVLSQNDPFPRLRTGDVVTLLDGEFDPIVIKDVTNVIIRAAPKARPRIARGVKPSDDEDECCIRVFDGCDRTQIIGLDLSGAYHGIRLTASAHCKVLYCSSHHNDMEGLLAGAVDYIEIGFCEFSQNGGGNNDRAHGLYVSYGTKHAQIHHNHCHDCSGSAIQLNGTAEIGGIVEDAHVWDCLLENCGVSGTPNLSLIAVRNSRFRRVRTRGGRGGMRIFADGGKASTGNQFFACIFDQVGTSFSCDFQERTRATTFDSDCTVSGPEWTASGGSSLPRVVTAERQAA